VIYIEILVHRVSFLENLFWELLQSIVWRNTFSAMHIFYSCRIQCKHKSGESRLSRRQYLNHYQWKLLSAINSGTTKRLLWHPRCKLMLCHIFYKWQLWNLNPMLPTQVRIYRLRMDLWFSAYRQRCMRGASHGRKLKGDWIVDLGRFLLYWLQRSWIFEVEDGKNRALAKAKEDEEWRYRSFG
jgi:hypothetical protein